MSKQNSLKLTILALVAATAIPSYAIIAMPKPKEPCIRKPYGEDYKDLVVKAGVVGEADRLSETEYAAKHGMDEAELKSKIAATGSLRCGEFLGVANLVGADNLIATVGHMISDTGSRKCNKLVKTSNCKFTYELNGEKVTKSVGSLVGTGLTCPSEKNNVWDDWAVLTLKSSADGVSPYDVTPNAGNSLAEGSPVVAVSAQAGDYGKIVNGKFVRGPKHLGNCSVLDIHRQSGVNAALVSDCDGANGASGAGMLLPSFKRPTIAGLLVADEESDALLSEAIKTGVPNVSAYDRQKWRTVWVPLNGKFLETVVRGMSGEVTN